MLDIRDRVDLTAIREEPGSIDTMTIENPNVDHAVNLDGGRRAEVGPPTGLVVDMKSMDRAFIRPAILIGRVEVFLVKYVRRDASYYRTGLGVGFSFVAISHDQAPTDFFHSALSFSCNRRSV